jgi:hypothetical protein
MSKNFKQAPKPPPLADNVIAAFERGGTGQDTRTHITTKGGMREHFDVERGEHTNPARMEPTEVGTREPSYVQTGEPTKEGNPKTTKPQKAERTRRLSIDLPESWHRRFKTACSRTDKKMLAEVTDFIKRRTLELEKE